MISIDFESCHHIYARGSGKGKRCNKPCDFGFCQAHMIIYNTKYPSPEFKIKIKDIESFLKDIENNIDILVYQVNFCDLIIFKKWIQSYNKYILKVLLLKESIILDLYHEIIKLYVPIECKPFIKVYQLAVLN
jgi:hypothetical protein